MPRVKPTALVDWTAVVVQGCACGGLIAANPKNPYEIEREVWRHSLTYQHRDWWARSGWAQPGDPPREMVETGQP